QGYGCRVGFKCPFDVPFVVQLIEPSLDACVSFIDVLPHAITRLARDGVLVTGSGIGRDSFCRCREHDSSFPARTPCRYRSDARMSEVSSSSRSSAAQNASRSSGLRDVINESSTTTS